MARIIVVSRIDGCRAPGPTAEESFSCTAYGIISARVCLGLTDLLPLRISVLGQVHQLAEVLGCLLVVTCAVGSASGSPERAEAIGSRLERDLEFVQAAAGCPISSSNSPSNSRNG